MRKRLLSLLLLLVFLFASIPVNGAFAQEVAIKENVPLYSSWAEKDLVIGETYGIFPQTWFMKGISKPITQAQLRVLMSGIRQKVRNTNAIVKQSDVKFSFDSQITVKEVLETFYTQLSAYEFDKTIGLEKRYSPLAYMAEYNIFTGEEGELSYDDICTVEQACVIATRLITVVYDLLDAGSKGFLWEANNGANTVYLLGSIHVASYDIYPFSQKILDAFAQSNVLAVELNLFDTNGENLMMQYGMYQDGTSLKDNLSPEVYEKTIALGLSVGYTEEGLNLFKPWVLQSLLSSLSLGTPEEAALASNLGIDMIMTIKALLSGKLIYEVEGYEKQLQFMDSLSPKLQEYLLSETVDMAINELTGESTDYTDSIDTMLQYWNDGDIEGFRDYITPSLNASVYIEGNEELSLSLTKEYKEKYMEKRDIHMATVIESMLNSSEGGINFIVLGSAHYISDYSVIDILENKGYVFNQVK